MRITVDKLQKIDNCRFLLENPAPEIVHTLIEEIKLSWVELEAARANQFRIKNWFSNMLPFNKPLIHEGIIYKTVENFYQAMKIGNNYNNLRHEISRMTPHESKKCFKDYPDKFIVLDVWCNAKKCMVMRFALDYKFERGTSWSKELVATGTSEIVEVNNWGDTFWGYDINKQQGQNMLGKMLMEIRSNLTI